MFHEKQVNFCCYSAREVRGAKRLKVGIVGSGVGWEGVEVDIRAEGAVEEGGGVWD